MKKILVALAMTLFATTSFAKVAGSKHDFNASSYGTGKSSRCEYCHVAHNAKTWANVALWATDAAGGTFELYSSAKVKATAISVQKSQTCLACHADGTTAVTFLNQDVTGSVKLDNDLRNDHPIGTGVVLGGNTNASVFATVIIGRGSYSSAKQSTVECSVCHSVHGLSGYTIETRKLLYGAGNSGNVNGHPASTDFCGICHDR